VYGSRRMALSSSIYLRRERSGVAEGNVHSRLKTPESPLVLLKPLCLCLPPHERPKPHTLTYVPYTLHPTPYTPHLTTCQPTPFTSPYTLTCASLHLLRRRSKRRINRIPRDATELGWVSPVVRLAIGRSSTRPLPREEGTTSEGLKIVT